MTPEERAKAVIARWRARGTTWTEEMALDIEHAITAAIEEDRKGRECCEAAARKARDEVLTTLEMGDIAEVIRTWHAEKGKG